MFIYWKKTPISDRSYADPYCIHTGPGRSILTPMLKQSYRDGGKPRNRTLWRPSRGIRTCCIEDVHDPTARVAWWHQFEVDFWRLQGGLDESERARLREHYKWITDEIAQVVPRPSPADEALWFCMKSLQHTWSFGESREQRRVRLLDEARRLLEERQRSWWEQERHYWQEKAEAARREPPRERAGGSGAPAPGPQKAADPTPWFIRELGLTWPCTEAEVKAAWRRGVKTRHPDQGGSSESFIAFKKAYDNAVEFLRGRAAA